MNQSPYFPTFNPIVIIIKDVVTCESDPFVVVQLLSHIWLFANPRTAKLQASLSFTLSQNFLKLMSIELMMLSNHLILYCPLLLLPSTFPSISIFSNESALHIKWTNYWSFSFGISLPNEYSELIFFRIDLFDLLAVQGTLKSLLQHHNLKASIFGPQPSLQSSFHICTWLLEKPWLWLGLCRQSDVSAF